MVKRAALTLAALLLAFLLILCAALLWLLTTSGGARWLLESGAGLAGAELSIGRVEGSLAGELILVSVRFSREQTEADFDRLRLDWQPGKLLAGELALSELSLQGARIVPGPSPPSEEPLKDAPGITWPRLSGWPLQLDAKVDKLRLEDVTLHPSEGEPLRLESLTAGLAWEEGRLAVDELAFTGEGYRLEGDAAAGFVTPLLQADLHLRLPQPMGGIGSLRLTADLAGDGQALLAGPLELKGSEGDQPLFALETRIGLRRQSLLLRQFALSHADWNLAVRGEGEVALEAPYPFTLRAETEGFDLSRQTGVAARVGGRLEISGTVEEYGGSFALSSRGESWRQATLEGRFAGGLQQLTLSALEGDWLGGTLAGQAGIDWQEGIQAKAALEARGLQPSRLDPEWTGEINLDLTGRVSKRPEQELQADVKGILLDSRLRGYPLTGRADLSLSEEDLHIAALELHGEGFDLTAEGRLSEKVQVAADVSRLRGLLPGAAGSLNAEGWLRWREGTVAGVLAFEGEKIAYGEARAATIAGEIRRPEGDAFDIGLKAGGLAYPPLQLDRLALDLDGTLEAHQIRLDAGGPQGEGELRAQGRWTGEFWSGTLRRLRGENPHFGVWRLTDPVALQLGAGKVKVATMHLEGADGMALDLATDLAGSPLGGRVEGDWRQIDLVLLRPWLPEGVTLSGRTGGTADLRLGEGGLRSLRGSVQASGRLVAKDLDASFSRVEGTVDWDAGGLEARLLARLEDGAQLTADLSSDAPPKGMPQAGSLSAAWEGIALSRLRPWLPPGIRLEGNLRGQSSGEWRQGTRLSLTGTAGVEGGRAVWRREEGEIAFDLRTAQADWQWTGEDLQGSLQLSLAEYGRIDGSFTLPLPAQLPTSPRPEGPLSVRLEGQVKEQGLLSAIFPGLLRETQGQLALQLDVGGTWGAPRPEGRLRLSGAGAYLPAAGIEIEEVEATAELDEKLLRIESFSARSGEGRIEGEAEVRLDQGRPVTYEASLKGERFRAVDLPELQMLVSPDLRFRGDMEKLAVRGTLRLPELILIERERRQMVRESPDVVIVGRQAEARAEEEELPVELDLRVKVVLGDRVLIKYAGVDARLAGQIDLVAQGMEEISAQGEIRVEQGIYSTYGVKLDIERGRLLYAGGPIDRPTLDILALREIREVKAGVQVTGTPRQPVVELYSEPSMPDTDILSYIVLGHPTGGDRQSAGLLMGAASALLSRGESAVLQDRLKRRLGLDVLAIEAGDSEVEGSMVTIGKYLSPRLFISYGRSLFGEGSEAKLRYELGEHWDIESKMGEESGVDLFYRIEFE